MTLTILSLEELLRFLFLTVRLSALVMALPLFSGRVIPAPIKAVCIVTLSVSFYPLVQQQSVPIPLGAVHLGLLILGELLVGVLIGFVAQILFAGVQLGGEIMNQQMGLSFANILDPHNGQQSSIMSNFQYILAVLLFFSLQAHHWFIQAMAESLHAIPLLVSTVPTAVGSVMVMNVFMLSFPVTIGVGMIILIGALPYYMGVIRSLFGQLSSSMRTVMQLLGGG